MLGNKLLAPAHRDTLRWRGLARSQQHTPGGATRDAAGSLGLVRQSYTSQIRDTWTSLFRGVLYLSNWLELAFFLLDLFCHRPSMPRSSCDARHILSSGNGSGTDLRTRACNGQPSIPHPHALEHLDPLDPLPEKRTVLQLTRARRCFSCPSCRGMSSACLSV